MPTLKLSYFDMHGGRGETARVALHIGGIDFEDDRVPFKEFGERKKGYPFGKAPVLEVDGVQLAGSNGINAYVGRLAGLYPEDPLQAAYCDEIMDAVEDIANKVVATFSIKDEDEKKKAREALAEGPLSAYYRAFERCLEARGGEWFADNRLTVADLKVMIHLRHLIGGHLDYIPADLPGRVAPKLLEHYKRVIDHEGVISYYKKFDRGVEG